MIVIRDLKDIKSPIKRSVATVGIFDGVHLGHKFIIKKIAQRAEEIGAKSVVLTFEPHPLKVLNAKSYVPTLISLEHRTGLIGRMGIDYFMVLKFTKAFSKMAPEEFVKKVLVDKIGLEEIYIGEDFYFGRNAQGTPEALSRLGKDYGFRVRIIKPFKTRGRIVSSSLIRKLILKGEISEAAKFLGRPVSILGTVVRGSSRGRILGFPTANVNPHHEVVPPAGVYAVMVKHEEEILKGVLNIGRRPTFYSQTRDLEPTIEVHIFDFDKDVYGADLEIFFVRKIRDELRFDDRYDLALRIREDAETAKKILSL